MWAVLAVENLFSSFLALVLVLFTGMAIMADLAPSNTSSILSCIILCLDAIFSCSSEIALQESAYILSINLSCMTLFLLILITCNVSYIQKHNTTGSF